MAYTTIDNPELYFQTVTYTGNATARTITLDGDENMQPDLVWGKIRSEGQDHVLVDSVRGATKQLYASDNALEQTEAQGLTGFASDGFTLGTHAYFNKNTATYVAWCWKESATAGFDIVTATGTGSSKTISHSLSAVPHWIISKEKSGSANDWVVYHHKNTSAPETDKLILNETNATSDDSCWDDTAPTSSVFSVSGASVVNRSSSTYVYYLWSEKKGFSKFGSYTGNGNADGPFIYTGFKPAWVMQKNTSATQGWQLQDNKREGYNGDNDLLQPNDTAAESGVNRIDILSNGFKVITTDAGQNTNGSTYVYMAFAKSPFVNSNGVPATARGKDV
jgi:hypothetical protein